MVELSLGGNSYSVTRPKLRKWLSIEKIRQKTIESAERKDGRFVNLLLSYLSALLSIPTEDIENVPWYEIAEGYYYASLECYPKLDLSIISPRKREKQDGMPDPWEYDERVWYSWCNLIAKSYGWNIEYIAELDVDDGIALIQEINLDIQFRKEWEWSLSEIAWAEDKMTKKMKLTPLPRPYWMRTASRFTADKITTSTPTIKVKPSFLPAGVVITDEQNRNKTINHEGSIRPL